MEKVIMKKILALFMFFSLFFGSKVLGQSSTDSDVGQCSQKSEPGVSTEDVVDLDMLKKDELEWLEFGVLSEDEIAALERFNPPKPRKKTLSDWIAYLKLFLLGMKQSVKDLFVGSSKS